ncbi:MAG: hypothetical protein IID37_02620 [Planctomycetes bacterium]|nr:hypothetical protein [Planctomycetota bacterium]
MRALWPAIGNDTVDWSQCRRIHLGTSIKRAVLLDHNEAEAARIVKAVRGVTNPDRRAAYVEQACGRDTGLRARVEALLQADPPTSPASTPDQAGSNNVTRLLHDAEAGDEQAADALLPLVYRQLRAIAQQQMSQERQEHTLQATALVHEAYRRMVGSERIGWRGRAHFFVAASEALRRILIEHARKRDRLKRGGKRRRVPLSAVDLAADADLDEILSVDEAIRRLEEQDERLGRIVRLRFYAGLSVGQTAEALGVTDRTIRRDWVLARAWLNRALSN